MDKKILLYVVIGILVLGLLILTLFPGMIYAVKDIGNTNSAEKCAVPEGYTEDEWYEHMSHHPNIYADCLGK